MKITSKTKIKQNPDIVSYEEDGILYLVSSEKGEVYTLNEVSAVLWKASSKPVLMCELVDCLVEKFDVKKKVAGTDVIKFLQLGLNLKLFL